MLRYDQLYDHLRGNLPWQKKYSSSKYYWSHKDNDDDDDNEDDNDDNNDDNDHDLDLDDDDDDDKLQAPSFIHYKDDGHYEDHYVLPRRFQW